MDFAEAVASAVGKLPVQTAWVSEASGSAADQGGQLVGPVEPDDGDLVQDELIGAKGITFKGAVSGRVAGALKRLHQNLGHPTNRELVRHLRLGGANQAMVEAAAGLKCESCARCTKPPPQRVAKPTALLDFNDAVALDIIFLDTAETKGHLALNMVDIASSYQVVMPIDNRRADTVADAFYKHWASWAGIPGKLVLDLDTCFRDSFWDLTNADGIAMRCAAGQAHWQNGIAERYGGAWKAMWDRLLEEHTLLDADLQAAACAISEARNTLRNRSGFSPRQWFFGSQGRLGVDPDDAPHDLASLSHVTSDEKMSRKHTLKLGAKMAFFHIQNVEALKRAVTHKSRVATREYKPGDMVYVFREGKGAKQTRLFQVAGTVHHHWPRRSELLGCKRGAVSSGGRGTSTTS